jgi:hypothetical protein
MITRVSLETAGTLELRGFTKRPTHPRDRCSYAKLVLVQQGTGELLQETRGARLAVAAGNRESMSRPRARTSHWYERLATSGTARDAMPAADQR